MGERVVESKKGIHTGLKGEVFLKIVTFSNGLFLKQIKFFRFPS